MERPAPRPLKACPLPGRPLRSWLLGGLVLAVLAAGVAMTVTALRGPYHFAVVEPAVLYRSGQLGGAELDGVRAALGLATIVDLCVERRDSPKALEEQAFARAKGVRYVHLPVVEDPDALARSVDEFLRIIDDPTSRPVLVHCWQGVKRTGLLVAVYKMEYLHMSNAQALAELPAFGRTLEDFVDGEPEFIERYVPRWRRVDPSPKASTPQTSAK